MLPVAVSQSMAKLERRARRVRERLHPESIAERQTVAVEDRCLLTEPARDGMAWLHLYLASDRAAAVFDRVDRTARATSTDDGLDPHTTLMQRRADVATELLLGQAGESKLAEVFSTADRSAHGRDNPSTIGRARSDRPDAGVRATVHVTVPVLTLMRHDDAAGELAGYGPIDADTARRLAGTATSWIRILTHPVTGTVLVVDRESYAVPKDLQRYLQVRDETCRFPNCSRTAERCDLDHAVDWAANGRTAHDNLAHLCRPHHRLKHQTGWTVEHLGRGDLRWTSPTGRKYTTETATVIRR